MSDAVAATKLEQLERDCERMQRQRDLIMSLAHASAEPGGVEQIIRRALEIIVKVNGWLYGQFWIVRTEQSVIHCTDWYFATAQLPELRAASHDRRLSQGVGLPGRVWSTGFPLLLPDLENESGFGFPRKAITSSLGLKSAFAFPTKNGPFITGVFEFFDVKPIAAHAADNHFYEKLGIYIATLVAQKESEQAARRSEELNKIVLQHAYNAFVSINQASQIVQWSEKAESLFGWPAEEVLGKPLQEIIIPERYRDAHMRGLFKYMTHKEGPILNKRVRAPALHKNGSEIPIELLIFPIETLDIQRFGAFIIDCSQSDKAPDIRLE